MNRHVPTYGLYRADSRDPAEFWLHAESIPVRSRLHNWEIEPHRHEAFFQLLHISGGHGETLFGGAYRPFTAPAMIYIPAGETHGFRFSRDIEGTVVTVLADRLATLSDTDRTIARFAAEPRLVAGHGQMPALDDAAGLLGRLAEEVGAERAGRLVMMEALLTAAVVQLARAVVPGRSDDAAVDPRARRLRELVELHFREQPSAAFLADRLGVSPAHLNRLARTAFGESVGRLVVGQILRAAKRDLVITPTPVQAIAFSLGFSDPAYFNRFFRKETGMTPGAYRNSERRKLVT